MAPLRVDAALGVDRERHAVAGVAGGVAASPPTGRRTSRPAFHDGCAHAQRRARRARSTGRACAREIAAGHMRRSGPSPGAAVAALEGLARRAERRREVEVRAAADARWRRRPARPWPCDRGQVDFGEVVDVHRLLEVGVPEAPAALEHEDRASGPRRPRGRARPAARRRSTPPKPEPDDADVDALGHQAQVPAASCARARACAGRRSVAVAVAARRPGSPSRGSRTRSRAVCSGDQRRRAERGERHGGRGLPEQRASGCRRRAPSTQTAARARRSRARGTSPPCGSERALEVGEERRRERVEAGQRVVVERAARRPRRRRARGRRRRSPAGGSRRRGRSSRPCGPG